MISISTKIESEKSPKNIDENYLNHIISLFNDQRFCGLVAGKSNEALFVLG